MKKLISALLALSCGVVTGAECTSPPTAIWTDISESLLWKTVRESPIKVSVDWPKDAESATLSVARGGTCVTSAELSDRSVKVYPLAFAFPATENDEAVLDMTLTFRDSSNVTIAGATRVASIGLVRGIEGRSFRLISAGDATRQWKHVNGSAVAPIPSSTISVALDGQPLLFSDAPGWLSLSLLSSKKHVLVLNTDDGDSLSVPLFGANGFVFTIK